ncbi:enoyl-CoA hydratase-related protein [Sulfitobacter geojensis]|uniref:enoyl-CoA hydratase-related protein n=1 Tax=Sulfitobacter geojensis TaxID=1342299 RepID=UPI00046967C0|nr:enoyl-CoA hydratase-related protein [Sulfitobacter geojensis]KHA54234.1 Enoyl-CoA hydratase [Sulfitobacter geojensis]NYI30191.1 crotonobetainyl-CoA hydratase [Sulfitobacter geojensis]
MSYEFIKTEKKGHILVVTMNRPDVYNAVHVDMHNEMADCWDAFAADQDLWVAVLTGAGDKAFSAGNDLKATAAGGSKAKMTESGFAGLSSRFNLEKPIIAAVNGFAMGGGFETALSCDIILASENAKFALPEVKVGFFAAASGVQRLSRYIGRLAAQEMMYTGRTIMADEALKMGCVNEVHPHDQLMEKAMEKAEQLCTVSPSAVKATKRVMNDMYVRDGFADSIAFSREVIADLSKTEDFKEGVNAFVEKRAPNWVNK